MIYISVKSSLLLNTLKLHLKGRVRNSVTLSIVNEFLRIQSSNDFVFDTLIPCKYDGDNTEQFSFIIDSAVDLLGEEDEYTTIMNAGLTVLVNQSNVSIPFDVSYDRLTELHLSNLSTTGTIKSSDIVDITRGFRCLQNMSKSLEVGVPSVVVSSGNMYCAYSNTILIQEVPMCLPNFEIPFNTFNHLSRSISGSSITVGFSEFDKILILRQGVSASIAVPYKEPNKDRVIAIDGCISNVRYVGQFDIGALVRLSMLYKSFNRERVTLSFYSDNTVGVLFTINDGKLIKSNVKDIDEKFSIIISTSQFDSIWKCFNGMKSVKVFIGEGIICLKGMNSKTLIVSGMIL